MRIIVNKGFLVGHDVWMIDTGEDSDLIDSILFVFLWLRTNLDLLEGVNLAILDPLNFVNARIGAIAKLLDDHKVLQLRRPLILHLIWLTKVIVAVLFLGGGLDLQSVPHQLFCWLLAVGLWVDVMKLRLLRYLSRQPCWVDRCRACHIAWIVAVALGCRWLFGDLLGWRCHYHRLLSLLAGVCPGIGEYLWLWGRWIWLL